MKCTQREEKGNNKMSGYKGYSDHSSQKGENGDSPNRAHRRPQRKEKEDNKAGTMAIKIKGLQREEKGNSKESGCRVYADQGPAEGGGGGRQQRERIERLYRSRACRGRRTATVKR